MRRVMVGLATAVMVSAGLGPAGLGLGAGTAYALTGPFQWCPGQPLPAWGLVWDMSVCHSYYKVGYGQGNVDNSVGYPPGSPNIWDGDNPPPPNVMPCAPYCL